VELGGRGHTNLGSSNQHRIRAAASMFLSPKFQFLVEVNHDLARTGGFQQQLGLVARAVYVF
jgi:hypothetical protein